MRQDGPAINPHLADTGTPPIPEARAWLAAYAGRHGPAINLSQAVPGAPPPPLMLQRLGLAAASAEATTYGRIQGDDVLVDAYAAHVGSIYGTTIEPADIAITSGCNEAFFVATLAVAKAGDAVMLPAPWYFNHEMTLRMLGILPLLLPTHAARGFVPDAEEAADALRLHKQRFPANPVRAIVLVTPNNPTGAIYPAETIAAFDALAAVSDCWLILDETYRDFVPAPALSPHNLFASPDARQRLIQLYSFSKAYAIPGHRLGALIAPRRAMAQIAKALDCIQICPPRAAQSALAWAIPAMAEWRRDTAKTVANRAAVFQAGLGAASGWHVQAIGAYFAYVCHPFTGRAATAVARDLAATYGLLALPGSYFGPGQDAYLRFAFANVGDDMAAAVGPRLALASAGQ